MNEQKDNDLKIEGNSINEGNDKRGQAKPGRIAGRNSKHVSGGVISLKTCYKSSPKLRCNYLILNAVKCAKIQLIY